MDTANVKCATKFWKNIIMTNMNVIPVAQDSYIVNGCKVKITYAEDGDSMEVLQKLIHDTLREEAKNYS